MGGLARAPPRRVSPRRARRERGHRPAARTRRRGRGRRRGGGTSAVEAMIALVVFLVVGAAAAALLRPSLPPSIPGFLGALFLIGIACNGIALYVAGVVRLPLVFWLVPAASAIVLFMRRPPWPPGRRQSAWATVALALPPGALVVAAAILPVRDYDGRATRLPK